MDDSPEHSIASVLSTTLVHVQLVPGQWLLATHLSACDGLPHFAKITRFTRESEVNKDLGGWMHRWEDPDAAL